MCNASDYAVGAVLGQRHDKVFHSIYYASKTLTEAQLNYTTTEKEILVVVFAFDKFRVYLVGTKVIVYTNHSAIREMLNHNRLGEYYSYRNLIWKLETGRVSKIKLRTIYHNLRLALKLRRRSPFGRLSLMSNF